MQYKIRGYRVIVYVERVVIKFKEEITVGDDGVTNSMVKSGVLLIGE